jgi:hypothetical protein
LARTFRPVNSPEQFAVHGSQFAVRSWKTRQYFDGVVWVAAVGIGLMGAVRPNRELRTVNCEPLTDNDAKSVIIPATGGRIIAAM